MNEEYIGYFSNVIDIDRESRDRETKVIGRGTRGLGENLCILDPSRTFYIQSYQ